MSDPDNYIKAAHLRQMRGSCSLGQLGGQAHDDMRFMGRRLDELGTVQQAQLDMRYAQLQQFNVGAAADCRAEQQRAALYGQANQQNLFAQQAGLAQNHMAWRGNMAELQNRQMQGQFGDTPKKKTPIKHASWFRQWCWRRKLAFGEMLIRFGSG